MIRCNFADKLSAFDASAGTAKTWSHAIERDSASFGAFRLDIARGVLEQHGQAVAIRPKVYALLVYMVRHANRVIGKEELLRQVWGTVSLSDDVLTQSVKELRRVIEDSSGLILQTFPRRGYLFKTAVPSPAVRDDAEASQTRQSEAASGHQPSIAVLPFLTLSKPPKNDYLAAGIAEDITVGLSRIHWLLVIARRSSARYQGDPSDMAEIKRDLGAWYVVQGTVRRASGRLRITAQLVDTSTGATMWADRFESPVQDLFDLQDQIIERIVAAIEPNIQKKEIERARRGRPNDLRSYDLYLRAVPHTATQMPDDARNAMPYLHRALEIEPDFAAAHALLAWCHEWCFTRGGFLQDDRLKAIDHARRALASDNDDATALAIAGFVVTMLGDDRQAGLDANHRALALNPCCATAMYLGSVTHAFAGDAETAIRLADRAYRLSPYDLLVYLAELASGIAAVDQGHLEEAAAHLTQAVQANPVLSSLYFTAASAHALAGRLDRARDLAGRGLQREPTFRLRLFSELMAENIASRLTEGGRLAGLED